MSVSSRGDYGGRSRAYRRENSSNPNVRSSTFSNVVIDRNLRRVYRENDSLSGSRTRSSSRTTSGNPDSSRSRSSSPPYEEPKEQSQSERVPIRRKRFLQRWDDESSSQSPLEPGATDSDPSKAGISELPYVYQQPEFIRISQDIIRKCDAEEVLVDYFKKLDRNEAFDVSLVADQQLRKKLRHLSKALYLERNGSEFRRPRECKISLLDVFNELKPFIKAKATAQGPYQRKDTHQEPESEESERPTKRKLTAEEAAELLSLREMHEQGFFVDYENIQKEFIKKQKQVDLWGKSAEEQRALLASGEEREEEEQPWRTFDREKDLMGTSNSSKQEYDLLLSATRNIGESFKVASKSSSFT